MSVRTDRKQGVRTRFAPWTTSLMMLVGAAVLTVGCGGRSSHSAERDPDTSRACPDATLPPGACATAPSCDIAPMPCGGDVVGAWKVASCPLELQGEVDVSKSGLSCTGATVTSGSLEVSGTWTADELGNFVDNTTTKGVQQFEIAEACFQALEAGPCDRVGFSLRDLGYETVSCVDNAATRGCTCNGTFNQRGGLAQISPFPRKDGFYSASGTMLSATYVGYGPTYAYCVQDDVMVLTAPTPSGVGEVVGAVVLQRQ